MEQQKILINSKNDINNILNKFDEDYFKLDKNKINEEISFLMTQNKKELLLNIINDVLYQNHLDLHKKIYYSIKNFEFKNDYLKFRFFYLLFKKIEDNISYTFYFFETVTFLSQNFWKSKYDNIMYQIENTFWNFWNFVINNWKVKELFKEVFYDFLTFYSKTIAKNIQLWIFKKLIIDDLNVKFYTPLFYLNISKWRKIKSINYFSTERMSINFDEVFIKKLKEKIKKNNMDQNQILWLEMFILILNELSNRIFIKWKSLFSNLFRLCWFRNLENWLKKMWVSFDENILNYKNNITQKFEDNDNQCNITLWESIQIKDKKNDDNNLTKENLENVILQINWKILEYSNEIYWLTIEEKNNFIISLILWVKFKNKILFFKKLIKNKEKILEMYWDELDIDLKNILYYIDDLMLKVN